jgi:phosphopantothenoylcysteine decarboxylase/phosphopantothenate--cysteine ligase
MTLTGKRILLGVTGGIAAYKAAELVRLLVKAGADVRVAMTEAATRFIGTATMQALSGQPVWTDLWDARVNDAMGHIELSRDRELILVAPASADFMAKLAHGLCDDLLSTLCVARRCPLMVAPAMNVEMWQNAATPAQAPRRCAPTGVQIVGPASGGQACGEMGMGRMTEPADILADVQFFFQPKRLAGRRVVVTAGPTESRSIRSASSPTRARGRWATRSRARRARRGRGHADQRTGVAAHAGRVWPASTCAPRRRCSRR